MAYIYDRIYSLENKISQFFIRKKNIQLISRDLVIRFARHAYLILLAPILGNWPIRSISFYTNM